MNLLFSFLSGHNKNIERNCMIWNMISSLFYSFQSALLLLIVTRIAGLVAAGVFSITYSVSQMFASIGSFSMREYQVSDTSNVYSFSSYVTSRCLTILLMFLCCIGYSMLQGYMGEKLLVIVILSIYRAVDGFDDVFHGELQKQGRLDIAGRILAMRIASASILFCLAYYVTQNLLLSASILTVSSIFISGLLNLIVANRINIRATLTMRSVIQLLFACIPICAGAFLYNYLVNSPKYAIDAVLSAEEQGIFNILYMPLFVISMLSTFVFKPYVFRMGQLWTSNERKGFLRLCLILSGIILTLTICIILGGALLGIPVLNLVFHVYLNDHKDLFLLLLAFGGLSALNNFGTVVLTVMRKQIYILPAYCIALVIDLIFMNRIVQQNGIMGAGLVYGLVMGVIFVFYLIVIIKNMLLPSTGSKRGI